MITVYFRLQSTTEYPSCNFDEHKWNPHAALEGVPLEYSSLAEAFEVVDDSIKDLVEKIGINLFLDQLFWGFRMDQAVSFFHVTSSRNRYEHMRLHSQSTDFEVLT